MGYKYQDFGMKTQSRQTNDVAEQEGDREKVFYRIVWLERTVRTLAARLENCPRGEFECKLRSERKAARYTDLTFFNLQRNSLVVAIFGQTNN